MAKSKVHEDYLKTEADDENDSGQNRDGMSTRSDDVTGLNDMASASMCKSDASVTSVPHYRIRKLSWKDDFIVLFFCARRNLSTRRTSTLLEIGTILAHNTVCAWVNMLCLALKKFFPLPTHIQILRARPAIVIRFH